MQVASGDREGGLYVFREFRGAYEGVGRIDREGTFAYDDEYLASPHATAVSVRLPLRDEPFDASDTKGFFGGLIPEGSLGELVARATHAARGEFLPQLRALSNEPVGALLFSDAPEVPDLERGYRPLDERPPASRFGLDRGRARR